MLRSAALIMSMNSCSISRISGRSSKAGSVRAMPSVKLRKSGVTSDGQGERGFGNGAGASQAARSQRMRTSSARSAAAGKRQAIINDDDLLMMSGAERHGVVEAEIDLRQPLPAQSQRWQGFALIGEEDGIVPEQDAHSEAGLARTKRVQEIAELDRKI